MSSPDYEEFLALIGAIAGIGVSLWLGSPETVGTMLLTGLGGFLVGGLAGLFLAGALQLFEVSAELLLAFWKPILVVGSLIVLLYLVWDVPIKG